MMRGTVFLVIRYTGPEPEVSTRFVEQYDVNSEAAFISAARSARLPATLGDVRLEFGPIAPPWKRV